MKKNKIKRGFAVILLSLTSFLSFAKTESAVDEVQLYTEIVSSFSGAVYPQVVEYADDFAEKFPDSVYISKVQLYKGESCFHLSRYEDAEKILAVVSRSSSLDIKVMATYWHGRTLLKLGRNNEALNSLFDCCQTSQNKKLSKKSSAYYNLALYYAGETYFSMEEYEKAIPVFESIVSRGNEYSMEYYSASFEMLFDSYLKRENYQQLVSIYKKYPQPENADSGILYSRLSLKAADAYEAMGRHEEAWNCLTAVFESSFPDEISAALKKAYGISSAYEKATGKSTGEIFAKASEKLSGQTGLLAEFWTRLATDEYENRNFEKAGEYFSRAETYDVDGRYSSLIALYRASMNGNQLELTSLDEDQKLYVYYESSFAEKFAEIGDWDKCYIHAKNAYEKMDVTVHEKNLCQKAAYYYALSLCSFSKNGEALSIIENGKIRFEKTDSYYVPSCKILASIYAVSGRESDALAIYSVLDSEGNLNSQEKADYAKLLFTCGYLGASKKVALSSSSTEALYVAAIASFNLKEWSEAESNFQKFLNANPKSNREFAEFYLGYCQYRLGKSKSVEVLSSFSEKYPNHSLCYNACLVCANAALAVKDFETAGLQASKAIDYSRNMDEKEQAVFLASSIYQDSGKSGMALKVLSPYLKDSSDFGIRARFQTALIYSSQKDLNSADRLFGEIQNKFSSSAYSDESAYRRGELYYSAGNYSVAAVRFSEYRKKFPKGRFSENALYYLAESFRLNGQKENAILNYEVLLLENAETSFAYSCCKNLALLFKESGRTEKASFYAQKMLSLAVTDQQKSESRNLVSALGKISGGEKSRYVVLSDEYRKKGEAATFDGRCAGTELAEYLWNEGKTDEAVELAEKLYSIQTKSRNISSECGYAARCAVIMAKYERNSGENSSSAEIYLLAAKYARQSGDRDGAARALYGAAEAFDAAGRYGDSGATAKQLAELYPDTTYAASAKTFIKGNTF